MIVASNDNINVNVLKVVLDDGAVMPTRAHFEDAGLDLYAREDVLIPAEDSAKVDTGVHVAIPTGFAGFLKSRSGLNINHDVISEGVIDAGYTGSIVIKLHNLGHSDYFIKAGDKVSQLVILPIITPTPVLVDSLDATDRGDAGFGSTGR